MSRPSAPLTRRQLVLGLVLGATLAASLWVSQAEKEQEPVEAPAAVSTALPRLPAPRDAAPEVSPLQPGRLTRREPVDPTQDAFASRSWVAPPLPVQEARPPAPSAPPLPFTYMGKMQQGETGPITIYLMQGEQAYIVRKGDVIDKTYRVESIDAERMVLTYLPLATRQTLTFGIS